MSSWLYNGLFQVDGLPHLMWLWLDFSQAYNLAGVKCSSASPDVWCWMYNTLFLGFRHNMPTIVVWLHYQPFHLIVIVISLLASLHKICGMQK